MRLIVGKAQGIGDPDAREGDSLLALQIGDGLGETVTERRGPPLKKSLGNERCDRLGRHRAISEAPGRARDLNQGLKPQHAARAVAHDAHSLPCVTRCVLEGPRHLVGSEGLGAGIDRDVDRDGTRTHADTASVWLMISSKRRVVTRPYRVSPTCMAGPMAHWPRQ